MLRQKLIINIACCILLVFLSLHFAHDSRSQEPKDPNIWYFATLSVLWTTFNENKQVRSSHRYSFTLHVLTSYKITVKGHHFSHQLLVKVSTIFVARASLTTFTNSRFCLLQNNNTTSGAVWLRSMVFKGKCWEKFPYLGKEGGEKNIWSNMCSRILEEQDKLRSEAIIWRIGDSKRNRKREIEMAGTCGEDEWGKGGKEVIWEHSRRIRLNKTPTWCNRMQILLLQTFSTCLGRYAPIIRSIKYWHGSHRYR